MTGVSFRFFRIFVFAFCLMAFTSLAAWGQNVGSIGGSVKDPERKAVADAKVTATNLANNDVRTTQTDGNGSYGITSLEPGTYKVEIAKDGFKTYLAQNVVVLVSTPTTLDVPLELGVATQTIIIEGTATPTLNTQDATVGTAFQEQQIKDLPIAARNVATMLSLQPGVVFTGRTNTDLLTMGSNAGLDSREGVVNGIRGNQSNVTVDGVDSNDWHNQSAFTSALPVTLDSVQEFRVTTTSANATDGLTGGAQVALVTKSGSNDFHGNVRWIYRTTGLSANSFFNNLNGIPRSGLQRNFAGASLGGRFIKDRFYFFLDNEERRDAFSNSALDTVATDNLRDGVLIYQCATASSCPGGTVTGISGSHTVAPGFFGLTPANLKSLDPAGIGINPAMQTYMGLFPHGNDPTQGLDSGLNFIGFRFNAPFTVANNIYTARLDYKITKNGNHTIFWRGTLEGLNATITGAQFPGEAPASNLLNNSRGYAINYEAVLSPTWTNLLKYGLTRQGVNQSGTQGASFDVRSFTDIVNFGARQAARIVPVHTIGDDMTLVRGRHTMQFGGSVFIIHNNVNTQSSSFPSYDVNNGFCVSLCSDVANSLGSPGPGAAFPVPTNGTAVTRAFMMLTGSMTQFNDTALGVPSSGTILPVGSPSVRHFAEQYVEGYWQDSWKARSNLTITYGIRYGYETPVYETGGFEVAPTFDIMKWFQARIVNMNSGVPSDASPLLSWDLAGKANSGRNSWYDPNHKDLMPRLAVAYSPGWDNGIARKFFGNPGQSVIRIGAGVYDDKVGQAIAIGSDVNGSPGTSTALINSSQQYTLASAPRFSGTCTATGCTGLPAISTLLPVPTTATFPFTPASTVSLLGFAVDPHLRTPYAIHLTASFQRELPKKFVLDIAYVGTLGRELLGKIDYGQYLDIRDPKSGMDLFSAFQKIAQIANITPTSGAAINPRTISQLQTIQSIPFFDNMVPNMPAFLAANFSTPGYSSLTPTQAFYAFAVRSAGASWSCALFPMDVGVGGAGHPPSPWNSTVDPQGNGLVLFQPQFQGLAGWTNEANSNYHSLQVSVRRNVGSMAFTANYVYSKAIDNGSGGENVDLNSTGGAGTFGALIQNPFNLRAGRSVSDFNLKHNFNGTVLYDFPFGKGRRFGSNVGRIGDAVIGGWEFVAIVRWHSGFPFGPGNGFNFPTNFELTTPGTLQGPVQTQITYSGNVGTTPRPNIFADANKVVNTLIGFTLPGLSGSRNTLTGPAYSVTDLGLFKSFKMPWKESQSLQLRITAFNAFNQTNFNGFNTDPTSPGNFGNFTSTVVGGSRQVELTARFTF
jgi:Carboxypeptidase regulatory-like domain